MICPRCTKATDGIHTCTPTAEWRRLEAENAALKKENEVLKERQDFAPDQWWIKELGGIDSCCRNLTQDEYRAVRIAVTAINVLLSENVELRKAVDLASVVMKVHSRPPRLKLFQAAIDAAKGGAI